MASKLSSLRAQTWFVSTAIERLGRFFCPGGYRVLDYTRASLEHPEQHPYHLSLPSADLGIYRLLQLPARAGKSSSKIITTFKSLDTQ